MEQLKCTISDLNEFIDANLRMTSPKTGKPIKINTYGMKKTDLLMIIAKAECQKEFEEFLEEKKAGYHFCRYCGNKVYGDDKDELCDECKEVFGHRYFSEL